jgi:hypothetical protein
MCTGIKPVKELQFFGQGDTDAISLRLRFSAEAAKLNTARCAFAFIFQAFINPKLSAEICCSWCSFCTSRNKGTLA